MSKADSSQRGQMHLQIPRKFHPRGFQLLYEDQDLIFGNKAAGLLTVSAKWEQENTVLQLLNRYVQKGNSRSQKSVYVVHRLDQATTGVLVFAKTERAQQFLKDHWKEAEKIYYAIVFGKPPQEQGFVESYLLQDEDYRMHSSDDEKGRFARTEYQVVSSTDWYSLLRVRLDTGRKNQIRVHMADLGCPIVGDSKYGSTRSPIRNMALHAYSLEVPHPHDRQRVTVKAVVPDYFQKLVFCNYEE